MSWEFVGFDTETTGVDPFQDHIISAAIVTEGYLYSWLIKPGAPIPEAAIAVHGITNERALAEGYEPVVALEQIASFISEQMAQGKVLVCFNAGFDINILETNLTRYGLMSLRDRLGGEVRPVFDPLVLDRKFERYRKGKRRLENLLEAYGIPVQGDLHDAGVDTQMTLSVAHAILHKYPQVASMNPDELHEAQQEWHREWAENFEQFLRSKGKNTQIGRQWP